MRPWERDVNETRRFRCVVVRKQKWEIEVEARSADEAKEKAEFAACHEQPDDDWAYETTAEEL